MESHSRPPGDRDRSPTSLKKVARLDNPYQPSIRNLPDQIHGPRFPRWLMLAFLVPCVASWILFVQSILELQSFPLEETRRIGLGQSLSQCFALGWLGAALGIVFLIRLFRRDPRPWRLVLFSALLLAILTVPAGYLTFAAATSR